MKRCEHPNPQPRAVGNGSVDIYCPECKLSVSERQTELVLAWSRKIQKLKEANKK